MHHSGMASASQRLVKIYVGDSIHPIQIQQSVLENTSDYFAAAFRSDRFTEARTGIMKFPEDHVEVWKVLVNWILRHEVPKALLRSNMLLAIRCWITGHKYDMKEFQDAVMLCMLYELEPGNNDPDEGLSIKLSPEMILEAFKHTSDTSVLRALVVERKVIEYDDLQPVLCEETQRDMEILDGSGFLPWFTCVKEVWWQRSMISFMECKVSERQDQWKQYMVGSASIKGLPPLDPIPHQDA